MNVINDACPLRGKIYYEKWIIRDEKGGSQETHRRTSTIPSCYCE
ncbi:MAG: hypothetical protein Q8K92_09395 [Leadbetterella sp.]|nr:hypothetical protein [Leadbetterella sp.]